ncbi:MAG TPA: hypothetical protein PK649_09985 [Vicingus sp.]|nr:hypothetical protein [Flavobacteriales bacterium]HRN42387.1 hypothetical protein [Vicingus sp.]HRP61432.1 hypothetical protein [Vicingus sp.]
MGKIIWTIKLIIILAYPSLVFSQIPEYSKLKQEEIYSTYFLIDTVTNNHIKIIIGNKNLYEIIFINNKFDGLSTYKKYRIKRSFIQYDDFGDEISRFISLSRKYFFHTDNSNIVRIDRKNKLNITSYYLNITHP